MEIEFIEEKENKLFNRKEIKFYVDYDGEATPKVKINYLTEKKLNFMLITMEKQLLKYWISNPN